jgi:hypothetical protein
MFPLDWRRKFHAPSVVPTDFDSRKPRKLFNSLRIRDVRNAVANNDLFFDKFFALFVAFVAFSSKS